MENLATIKAKLARMELDFFSNPLRHGPYLPSPLAAPSYYAAIAGLTAVLWYVLTSIAAWHRLSRFPAVHWSAHFSYFWAGKTVYSGKQYWVHRAMFDDREEEEEEEAPLLRTGPNELTTNDPDVLRRVNAARSGYDRSPWYTAGRFNPYYDNMFTVLKAKEHARFRARTAAAYTGREIPDLEAGVDEQLATFCDRLRGYVSSGRLLALGPISTYFTVDVVTRLGFGKEFGFLADESDKYNFLHELKQLWPRMSTSADVPWIRAVLFSKPVLMLLGPKPRDKTGFGALMGVAEKQVGKRFAQGAEKKRDMLASFMSRGLDQTECEVEGLFMLVAGTESTASAIRCIMMHAMTMPSVYRKLKTEIRAAVRDGRASSPIIKAEEARELPYLQAVLYEGIRMRPPLLGLMPKIVPPGGDTLAGRYVPAGTAICSNVSSLLRSTAMFGADADVYRPERFMELGPEDRAVIERDTELAFGSGQWQCVGKAISFMEMNKIVFETFRRFDLQLACPLKPCEVESYGVFLESDMMVKVTTAATE